MINKEIGYSYTCRGVLYPAIYKHFKDKYYATMGASTYISIDEFNEMLCQDNIKMLKLPTMHVSFTEEDKDIVCINYEDQWYHFDAYEGVLVLYKSLCDNKGTYARPLKMFLSEVDKEKYPDTSQEYRFELVRY